MSNFDLILGDCLEVMKTFPDNHFSSIVTDPPYGLKFMGKNWDHGVPGVPFWEAALRVAKPGAMLLAFGGTRTHHRLMVAIEDAGWELRDCLMWLHGSGMPKGINISKAIDKTAGAEREVVGRSFHSNKSSRGGIMNDIDKARYDVEDLPATDAAKQWDGWNSQLKPSFEPIILARKPLSEPTIAANVLKHGTGGINVDACRIGTEAGLQRPQRNGKGVTGGWANYVQEPGMYGSPDGQGRWPANLALSDDAAAMLDEMSGERKSGGVRPVGVAMGKHPGERTGYYPPSRGGASRFFLRVAPDDDEPLRFLYEPKASKRDRDEGLEGMPERPSYMVENGSKTSGLNGERYERKTMGRNHHITVKPTALMRWLVRLVTPPGGIVLDPFVGSGSTLKAAILEGFDCAGIDLDSDYLAIAGARAEDAKQKVHP